MHIHAGRVPRRPRGRAPELGPGDYARYSGAVPHLYEALGGEATGTLLILSNLRGQTPLPKGV
jgi:hypothetical protein